MASLTTIVGVMGSVAVAGLSVTGQPTSNRSFTSKTVAASEAFAPTAKPRIVHVTGEDFKFDAPDIIPAGYTEFRFLNKGPSIHHMELLKLTGGKTIDDLRAALANPGPPPSWMKEMGGPNAPDPGKEANATMMLEPGNYALICFVDIGGPPHFTKGMIRPLQVVPAKSSADAKPKADLTVDLYDYNFKTSRPIRAGTHTIRVHNSGPQIHEVELIKLAPGKSMGDFMTWMGKMEGPPPASALGGIAGLASGMTEYFTADFTPGAYAFVCFIPDAKDGKPHFAHGMMRQFDVK